MAKGTQAVKKRRYVPARHRGLRQFLDSRNHHGTVRILIHDGKWNTDQKKFNVAPSPAGPAESPVTATTRAGRGGSSGTQDCPERGSASWQTGSNLTSPPYQAAPANPLPSWLPRPKSSDGEALIARTKSYPPQSKTVDNVESADEGSAGVASRKARRSRQT